MATKTAAQTVPSVVTDMMKANEPDSLVVALIALFQFGTPYKFVSTTWGSEIPSPIGTIKASMADVYRTRAVKLGFAPEDQDLRAVTTRMEGEGVIVGRWFGAKTGGYKITINDPNYIKAGKKGAADAAFGG